MAEKGVEEQVLAMERLRYDGRIPDVIGITGWMGE